MNITIMFCKYWMILPAILLGSWSVHAVTTGNERDFRTEFETVGDIDPFIA